ncbi:type II secretion system secretin GspD [Allochromatium vinosum]|uniref:General secretion pathway protein D n=1 Tax=Allochromatium vinosum (strain ATCC 17899 / DSM 180 / NBRC 103801 / NCIMB 10441 / D) TaxID=572477 RepID=D3RRJ5_ALLVD|nr:type II secretion system secretin GspD [Allochromatium vinosum]ADC63907.1 general secretion pathway protein D [Allochromatium vinosum DSM 180]
MYFHHPARRHSQLGHWLCVALLAGIATGLQGCERANWDPTLKVGEPTGHVLDEDHARKRDAFKQRGGAGAEIIAIGDEEARPKSSEIVQRGSGSFVRRIAPSEVDASPGDVTLNFDGTDIREVVKVILGDLLKVNYVLHPAVQGATSLQTGRPLRREDLLPTLETLLRMNNAALVQKGDRYEVVPLANAVQGRVTPQLGETDRALPNGYSVQVVPLRYIGAEEMNSILTPLAPEGSVIRVDNLRNLLVIAGTSPEMSNLLDTIRVFDVDWMSGLSVGFFVLEYAKSKDVVTQLESLLADESGNPLKGIFRFIPVESANALLVVSPQERYLQQVRNWIERLDMAEARSDSSERLYVYRVKHSDAESLADILSQLFGGTGSNARKSSVGNVAPGLGRSSSIGGTTTTTTSGNSDSKTSQSQTTRQSASSHELEMSSSVNIVADAVNNSLLVRASPRDYKKILDALKQLDILPLQVLVEATIVEITLSGSLKYGVQWELFGPGADGKSFASLDGTFDDAETSGIGTMFPGFNWAMVSNPDTIKATLSALAGDNLLNVLSSPSVMVMDNQTAKIQVGREVPIATSKQDGTSTTDRTYTTISYKDTGVILTVKPRVTPGGLVQLEIEQEVSTVFEENASGLNSPSFKKRTITSSVAVRSNQAVVLGGLIEDTRSDGKQGIPGLYSLPVVGGLFGETSKSSTRTELVVVLTPKVIANDQDIESVTEDFRQKVRGLKVAF